MGDRVRAGLGVALVALALLPPFSSWLQERLLTHILGQYLLLVAGGTALGAVLGRRLRLSGAAAPAFLAALLTLGFWLLPRWIDAALLDPVVALAKALSLVVLVGGLLGWAWAQAGPILRGFVLVNALSMSLVMAWIQQAVPQRLCNAYLLSDQRALGMGFLVLAALLATGLLSLASPASRETEGADPR